MPIIYHASEKVFHLFNESVSYIIHILPNGYPGHVYYGPALRDRAQFSHLQDLRCAGMSAFPLKDRPDFSLENARQEYPCFGTSDFRQPAFEVLQENGSHIIEPVFCGHRIYAGKPDFPGLPHSYVESEEEADTLELLLKDELTGLNLTLFYTIFRDHAVIARSARFSHTGTGILRLNRALSMSVDYPDQDFVWMQFSGSWSRERRPVERPVDIGVTAIESMRGHSSSHENPFVILKRPHTTEQTGEAYGFSFVYSGNFLAQAEADTYGMTRFSMGINPREFCWKLESGGSFQTPEVLMSYSGNGLNGLSHTIHRILQQRVARGPWRDRERPVLLNNWEATYMDFTEDQIVRIAQKGREAGVELFVLDDGWFGHRTEFSGLGDWYPDTSKLPNGLAGLSKRITDLGLKFGIWIEPEMVNEDSDLYRAHPEYALCTPGRRHSLGRNQMVLDFSNPNVVDAVFDMLMKSFEGCDLSYIKWDMNRSITECYSAFWPADQQGEIYHRYILGMYSLYEKLLGAFPDILIESCASGGCRFDAGMLYYAPQAWCSDDTDAMERIRIQYGTSYGYPVSSWGAHVSECPNQQVGRVTSLKTRANVAYFGAFGYEMDLNELSEEEMEEVRSQIRYMKENRRLFQFGTFYRLMDPYRENFGAWMVVSEDRTEAIVGLYQFLNQVNMGFLHLPLAGLDPDMDYDVEGVGVFGGDELMQYGIMPYTVSVHPMEIMLGVHEADLKEDFDSKLFRIRAVHE